MKRLLRYLVPVLSLATAAGPALRAADDDKPAPKAETKTLREISPRDNGAPDGGPRIERRFGLSYSAGPVEKETVTFLGVETAPVSATLTAQLGLPEGAGLVVAHLAPDTPAAGALKEHDILLKLDDQLLIEQRQLSVLVRNHKEGDEVTLTYVRGGKQATVKVKLAKHEVPKVALQFDPAASNLAFASGGFGPGLPSGNFDVTMPNPNGPQDREMVERMLPLIGSANATGLRHFYATRTEAGPGEHNLSVTVNTGNSHMVLDDDHGSIELTIKDGKKELVAKNAKGDQVFSGPVNTAEERKALPADVRGRLERLEDSTQFGYKPAGEFKTQTRIIRPAGQGIALPAPTTPAPRSTLFF